MGLKGGTYAQKQNKQITPNKCSQNPKISPTIVKVQAKRSIKLITDFIRAELTRTRSIIHNVSSPSTTEKLLHVAPASLARGRRKVLKFLGSALDRATVKFSHHHTTNETRERIKLIKPRAPEFRDLRFWDRDTAEEGECDDNEGIKQRCDKRRRCDSGHHLSQGDRKQFSDEHHEKLIPCPVASVLETRHVVQWQEETDSAEDRIGQFSDDKGRGECELAVHFRGCFAVVDHPR